MVSPRKQPTAGPRFTRGPEWLWWTGLLVLLVYGGMHWRLGNKPAGKAGLPEAAPNEISQQHQPSAAEANRDRERGRAENGGGTTWAGALAAVEAQEDAQKREEMLDALVDRIAVADIQSTLNELQHLAHNSLIEDVSVRLVRRWAENDGRAAAAWVEQLPEGPMRANGLSGVAIEWANTGLKDAAAWAGQLPDPAEQDSALLSVANEAVRSEPMEALDMAVKLVASAQRDELIQHAAMEWAGQDPKSARDWARQIPEGTLRNQVLSAVATAWSESDPASAALLAVGEISGRAQTDAVMSIIQRWAQQQPGQAALWVEQFPAGELKQTAINNLAALGVAVR